MNNPELIASFSAYLRAERDATENTIENYAIDLRKFAEWFEKPLARTKRTDVQKYLSELLQTGASGTTAREYCCEQSPRHLPLQTRLLKLLESIRR